MLFAYGANINSSAYRVLRDLAAPLPAPEAIGKYRVISRLGPTSGQGEVFRAVHPRLEKELVIKWSRQASNQAVEEIHKKKLLEEGKLLASVEHANLARVYDLDFHEGRPFLALEYIRGRNLGQLAADEPLSPRQSAELMAKLAGALGAAHRQGVVHLDIKPGNILVDGAGEPRLIDFGLALIRDAWTGDPEKSGEISGTVAFMSPEQARGEREKLGPRSDIFSLGATLYALLTGRAPFDGKEPREALGRAQRCEFDRQALERKGIPLEVIAVIGFTSK